MNLLKRRIAWMCLGYATVSYGLLGQAALGAEAAKSNSRSTAKSSAVKHSAERAVYGEVIESTGTAGGTLKWRAARVVNHEEELSGTTSEAKRGGSLKSILSSARQNQTGNSQSGTALSDPFGDRSRLAQGGGGASGASGSSGAAGGGTAGGTSGGTGFGTRSPMSSGTTTEPNTGVRSPGNTDAAPDLFNDSGSAMDDPFQDGGSALDGAGPQNPGRSGAASPFPSGPSDLEPPAPGQLPAPRNPVQIETNTPLNGETEEPATNADADFGSGGGAGDPLESLMRPNTSADRYEPANCDDNEECRETLKTLKQGKLSDIGLDIRVTGTPGNDYPCECPLGEGETLAPRMWASTIYTWKASGLCHKPLYFEEVALERYGHSWGPFVDPVVSAAHFFVAIPLLPYKMGLEPPNECIYTLGYYRPGNCAPYLLDPIPISPRGALLEAGAIVGVGAIVP